MTYCNEKGMVCEWANIGGSCSVSACRKMLFTPGGWPIVEQPEFVKAPMTNADKIRSMADDELAQFLSDLKDCAGSCLVGKGIKDCSGICATKDTLAVWLRLVAV